jgi:hypothetical protein
MITDQIDSLELKQIILLYDVLFFEYVYQYQDSFLLEYMNLFKDN